MGEFLSDYGSWIIFGGMFLLMMRLHGAGGCCGGHSRHGKNDEHEHSIGSEDKLRKVKEIEETSSSNDISR